VKSGQRIPLSSHLRCRCPSETSRSCSIPASGTDKTNTDTSRRVLRLVRASRRKGRVLADPRGRPPATASRDWGESSYERKGTLPGSEGW